MKRSMRGLMALTAAALIGAGAETASARIPDLGGVLKAGGIIFAVRQFGGEINRVITGVLNQRGVPYQGATKVVPVLSIGRGAYVGAAQVAGPPEQVREVRGVGQVETRLGDIDGNLLVPTNTTTPGKDFRKIQGVGVSALIDFEI